MTEQLTPRQIEIARMVAAGRSYKAIARALGITVDTVNFHVQEAADRLPGRGTPRLKLVVFVVELMREEARQREAS